MVEKKGTPVAQLTNAKTMIDAPEMSSTPSKLVRDKSMQVRSQAKKTGSLTLTSQQQQEDTVVVRKQHRTDGSGSIEKEGGEIAKFVPNFLPLRQKSVSVS